MFHAASPVLVASEDPQNEVIGPAVAGTTNVLASCAKSRDTVKRIVLTGYADVYKPHSCSRHILHIHCMTCAAYKGCPQLAFVALHAAHYGILLM